MFTVINSTAIMQMQKPSCNIDVVNVVKSQSNIAVLFLFFAEHPYSFYNNSSVNWMEHFFHVASALAGNQSAALCGFVSGFCSDWLLFVSLLIKT